MHDVRAVESSVVTDVLACHVSCQCYDLQCVHVHMCMMRCDVTYDATFTSYIIYINVTSTLLVDSTLQHKIYRMFENEYNIWITVYIKLKVEETLLISLLYL